MPGSDVPAWSLRASSDADFEWAFELHRAALYEREGLRVVSSDETRVVTRAEAGAA